jgi:hypothetical protein
MVGAGAGAGSALAAEAGGFEGPAASCAWAGRSIKAQPISRTTEAVRVTRANRAFKLIHSSL